MFFVKLIVDFSGKNVNRTASTALKIQESFQLVLYSCIISMLVRSQLTLGGAVNGGAMEFRHQYVLLTPSTVIQYFHFQ